MQRWLLKAPGRIYGFRSKPIAIRTVESSPQSVFNDEEQLNAAIRENLFAPKTYLLGVYRKAAKDTPRFQSEMISSDRSNTLWKATVSVNWPVDLVESAVAKSKNSAESKAALQLYLKLKNDYNLVPKKFVKAELAAVSIISGNIEAKPKELPANVQTIPASFLDQFPINPYVLLLAFCENCDPPMTLKIDSYLQSSADNMPASWLASATVDLQPPITVSVIDSKKSQAELKASGLILEKLRSLGLVNQNFQMLPKEVDDLSLELPKLQSSNSVALMKQFYDVAAHEMPELTYSRQGPLWFCTAKMTWPVEFQTPKMNDFTKTGAKQKACGLIVAKLTQFQLDHFDENLNPVAYTKEELQKLYDSYRQPLRLSIPKSLTASTGYLNVCNERLKAEFSPLRINSMASGKVVTSVESFSERPDDLLKFQKMGCKLNIISGEPIYEESKSFAESSRNHELYTAQRRLELNTHSHSVDTDSSELRNMLPIFAAKNSILEAIESNQVVIVTGETGSGKSTQVPQYILERWIQQFKGSGCNIVMTQPRRISAIAIASRIAQERKEKLGETVGFSVRMERFFVKKPGALLVVTPGMLVNCMLQNEDLEGISHVIIDEIHERDISTDFLLIMLKRLLKFNADLKLILMSATGDMRKLCTYFPKAEVVPVGGRSYRVKEYFLSDIKKILNDETTELWQYQRPRQIVSFDLVVNLISHIHSNKPDGAILCFLPTWNDIQITKNRLKATELPFEIHCAHSRISLQAQQKIFNRPHEGYRKVILATNVAETSITINDVVYVVNSGLTKDSWYKPTLNATEEKLMWASKASQIQRRGRAGRLMDGECYHLMSADTFTRLAYSHQPRMQRASIEHVVVMSKLFNEQESVQTFLLEAIDPPSESSIEAAMTNLKYLNILDAQEKFTLMGRHLAHLRCNCRLAIALLYSTMLSCANPVLSLCGSLESGKPLVKFGVVDSTTNDVVTENPSEMKPDGAGNPESDLMFPCVAIACFEDLQPNAALLNKFIEYNSLDSFAFSYVRGMKSILANGLLLSGILEKTADCWDHLSPLNQHSASDVLVKACLLGGFGNFLVKKCEGKFLKTRIKWEDSVFLDKCGSFIEYEDFDGSKDFSYFLYYNKKIENGITQVKRTTSVHPILPLIAGGSELTESKSADGNDVELVLENDKRFRYIMSPGDAEAVMTVRRVFKEAPELFLLQQYGATSTQKRKVRRMLELLATVIKTLSTAEQKGVGVKLV